MAMITRCPACTTLFKVVPDQLRISDGWVKCGMCAKIFDASLHLFHATIQTNLSTPLAPPATGFTPTSAIANTAPSTPRSSTSTALEKIDLSANPTAVAHSVATPVSFLQEPTVATPRHRPVTLALLWALAVVLALCLPGQWAYVERDRLAALYPQLKPPLQSLCIPLQCRLSAPMQIDDLVIDSAVLDRSSQGGYRLGFTLKNVSRITLALPVVELTLTDFADQPIIRRVLTLADLGASTLTLAAGANWQVALSLHLASEPSWPKVVGYRLVAFYP